MQKKKTTTKNIQIIATDFFLLHFPDIGCAWLCSRTTEQSIVNRGMVVGRIVTFVFVINVCGIF